ncbi:MAG: hypothetical protein ACFFEX_12210 [Candidatus Thorarchaeota archaeon]
MSFTASPRRIFSPDIKAYLIYSWARSSYCYKDISTSSGSGSKPSPKSWTGIIEMDGLLISMVFIKAATGRSPDSYESYS